MRAHPIRVNYSSSFWINYPYLKHKIYINILAQENKKNSKRLSCWLCLEMRRIRHHLNVMRMICNSKNLSMNLTFLLTFAAVLSFQLEALWTVLTSWPEILEGERSPLWMIPIPAQCRLLLGYKKNQLPSSPGSKAFSVSWTELKPAISSLPRRAYLVSQSPGHQKSSKALPVSMSSLHSPDSGCPISRRLPGGPEK